MIPDAIQKHPVKLTIGGLVAAASAFGGLAWKAFEFVERVNKLEQDQKWMRKDLKEAGIPQYLWEDLE